MKGAEVMQRVEAWRRGAPVPLGETLPWPRVDPADRLVLAFVRMAGEARPWGFAAGRPGEEPVVLTVPEPRDAAELSRLALGLAEVLLPHLPQPERASEAEKAAIAEVASRRQLWVPGATHVEMLHLLDYRFSRARVGEDASGKALHTLGRACGWLFRESTRPGQARVFDATRRLRDAFAIPAEDVRQAHLGFLLAWLATPGPREARVQAARLAEAQSVGVTLSPDLERDHLEPLVERWRASRDDPGKAGPLAGAIHAVLAPELLRRFRLAEQALRVLEDGSRPPNPGLAAVLALGAEEHLWQYWNQEQKAAAPVVDPEAPRFLGDHPETDFLPTQAAARFFAHAHAADVALAELVHGDPYLVRAAVDTGNAIAGSIVRVVDEGPKRAVLPVWTVVSPAEGSLRLREESLVCVVGLRGRTGKIRSIATEGGQRTVTVEIDGWKKARPEQGAPAADDAAALVGTEVILVDVGAVGIAKRKSMRVWDASGPGAWLTHAAPPPEPGERPAVDRDLVALVETLEGG